MGEPNATLTDSYEEQDFSNGQEGGDGAAEALTGFQSLQESLRKEVEEMGWAFVIVERRGEPPFPLFAFKGPIVEEVSFGRTTEADVCIPDLVELGGAANLSGKAFSVFSQDGRLTLRAYSKHLVAHQLGSGVQHFAKKLAEGEEVELSDSLRLFFPDFVIAFANCGEPQSAGAQNYRGGAAAGARVNTFQVSRGGTAVSAAGAATASGGEPDPARDWIITMMEGQREVLRTAIEEIRQTPSDDALVVAGERFEEMRKSSLGLRQASVTRHRLNTKKRAGPDSDVSSGTADGIASTKRQKRENDRARKTSLKAAQTVRTANGTLARLEGRRGKAADRQRAQAQASITAAKRVKCYFHHTEGQSCKNGDTCPLKH